MRHDAAMVQSGLPESLRAVGIIGTWFHDTAVDRVVADRDIARLFGIESPDGANGDPFGRYVEAVHPADRAGFQADVEIASRLGGPFASQYRCRTSEGTRWVHDYGTFVLDANGAPSQAHGIIIDVTRIRRGLEAVEEISAKRLPVGDVQPQIDLLADHIIAASKIARTLPSARLQALTDPLLWEVGRLVAWVTSRQA